MNKERLEKIIYKAERTALLTKPPKPLVTIPDEDFEWIIEQVEQVQELTSFKNSVEYTVDSETLELIISNQNSEHVISYSETYDEKIYLLQKRVQELEESVEDYKTVNKELHQRGRKVRNQNKRYREALEFYADRENYKPDHYDPNIHEYMSVIDYDEGATARQALEGESSKYEARINNLTFDLAVSRAQNKRYRERIEYMLEEAKDHKRKGLRIQHWALIKDLEETLEGEE